MKDHISICIPTYRRNQILSRLLARIEVQETDGRFDVSVVVVDNDKEGTAEVAVMTFRNNTNLVINYSIESEKSIPAARNHALQLAKGNYIGIIDDDELPPPYWLINLYNAIQTFGVDGALGPVHPFFERQPPAWLLKGKFCERPVHRTGTLLNWSQTRTGNVLLKKDVFEKNDLKFDENFKTGGSDQQFFKQAIKAGCRFVAVEEAPVYEIVTPERWQKSYYLKRAMVNGYNAYKYSTSSKRSISNMILVLKSIIALFAYTLVLPFTVIMGSHILIKYLEKGLHHLSRLFAMMNIEFVKKRPF